MRDVHVNRSENSTSNRPSAILDAELSEAQVERFNGYVAWAKGGENPGVDKGAGFSTASINGKFSVIRDSINTVLPPGSTYKDVAAFIDDALAFATKDD